MTACGRVQLRIKCVPEIYRIKCPKPQMYNKNCLEKGKGDAFSPKSFETLPFKSFTGLQAAKWQSGHSIGKNTE